MPNALLDSGEVFSLISKENAPYHTWTVKSQKREAKNMKLLSIRVFTLMIWPLAFAVISTAAMGAAPHISAPPDLAELIETGLTENEELQSLAAKVESLKELIPFAGSLEDL
jgi:hypothetical protein